MHCFLCLALASVVFILILFPEVHLFTPFLNGSLFQFLTPLFYFINFTDLNSCILLYVSVNLLQSVQPEVFLLLELLHLLSNPVRLLLLNVLFTFSLIVVGI